MKIVLKFGGTSLGSIEKIRKVAQIVKTFVDNGENQVVVVVSAMATVTSSLIEKCSAFYKVANNREYDAILSSGEQVSSGLLALAMNEINIKSQSLLAWQLPILTSSNYSNARIINIETKKIYDLVNNSVVPVIAGFQGVNDNNLTTLGRGGGDTTAVAVAVAFNADICYIYTDVEGVYSCDPRIVANACKISTISSKIMLEMATSGAKVVHPRAVELALKNKIKLAVKSSFTNAKGTHIIPHGDNTKMEEPIISAITSSNNEVLFTVNGLTNQQDYLQIISHILDKEIVVDMIKNEASNNKFNLNFLVSRDYFDQVLRIVKDLKSSIEYEDLKFNTEITKVSIVGVGLQNNPLIMKKMFKSIIKNGINILTLAIANLKVSLVMNKEGSIDFIKELHNKYLNYFADNTANVKE